MLSDRLTPMHSRGAIGTTRVGSGAKTMEIDVGDLYARAIEYISLLSLLAYLVQEAKKSGSKP